MIEDIQKKVYELLESPADTNRARKAVVYALFAIIMLNVILVILETEESIYSAFTSFFQVTFLASIAIFSVEYAARLWVCTCNPKYRSPVIGRIRYATSPLALFDLLAILPFYIPLIIPFDLRILRMMRLTRVFSVLKLGRFSHAWETFTTMFRRKKEELIISTILVFIMLTLSSTAMYYIENGAQPDTFSSIPATMWWGIVTLATVGYGDVVPVTPLGKVVGGIVALSGIALFALPAGIIASGFIESVQERHSNATEMMSNNEDREINDRR